MNPLKSYPFRANTFSVNNFQGAGKPVSPPVPAAVSASVGGWGGGKGMMMEELPEEAKGVDSEVSTHATVSDFRTERRLTDFGGKSSTELRRVTTELRARVRELEAKLAAETEKEAVSLDLYRSALGKIRKLTAAVAAAEAKIEALKVEESVSHFHPDPEADFVYDYTPLENISLPSFESVWSRVTAGVYGLPEAKTEPFPWTEVALATAGFILSSNAPKKWKTAKAVGYACSATLVISAMSKLLRHLA